MAEVRVAARYGTQPPPGPLDLGASLVLVGNLRLCLDAVEADLLGAASDLGMSWDLIAAILGIPADDARLRLSELRARPEPPAKPRVHETAPEPWPSVMTRRGGGCRVMTWPGAPRVPPF